MITEEYRTIDGYENYQISNFGNIKNKRKLLKLSKDKHGYYRIALWKNQTSKKFLVHRLVMLVFVGPSVLQVNHKDGIKTNNKLNNLEYVTCRENIKHAFNMGLHNLRAERNTQAILTWEKVRIIRKKLTHLNNVQIGKLFNVNRKTIADVRNNKTWTQKFIPRKKISENNE